MRKKKFILIVIAGILAAVPYKGYTVDGGHFTHEGYMVVTKQITPVLRELLGK